MVKNNVIAKYKKASNTEEESIIKQERDIASKLDIADRVEIHNRGNAFITLKDNKDHFQSNPKCR